MKARVLVIRVNDGIDYIELSAIVDEYVMDNNPGYILEKVDQAKKDFGKDLVTYGFVDIEIPNDVIDSVVKIKADAGVVTAKAIVEEEN